MAGVLVTLYRHKKHPEPSVAGTIPIWIAETLTDADGTYRIGGLKAGDTYQLDIKPPFQASDPIWPHQSPNMQRLSDSATGDIDLRMSNYAN